jgi:thiamine biosynthesis lipoprotein
MACEFEVLLHAKGDPAGPEAAIAALDLVERLEAQLTVYRDTSEVMAINRLAAGEAVAVEPGLFDLLMRAVDFAQETDGALDITSGPLIRTWGFHRRQGQMPSDGEIAAALTLVGSRFLELDEPARTIRFLKSGMELNLGAIGKGYALDRAAGELVSAGIGDFLIHGGNSSVLARGNRQSAECGTRNAESDHAARRAPQTAFPLGWSVALRHPLKPDMRLAEFRLINQALGTSGSGTQFFHHQGRRYGHILDPRTGRPAEQVLSATVIAPTAEQADALSTAFYVLGLAGAQEYCIRHSEIGALLVTTSSAGSMALHPVNLRDEQWRRL